MHDFKTVSSVGDSSTSGYLSAGELSPSLGGSKVARYIGPDLKFVTCLFPVCRIEDIKKISFSHGVTTQLVRRKELAHKQLFLEEGIRRDEYIIRTKEGQHVP